MPEIVSRWLRARSCGRGSESRALKVCFPWPIFTAPRADRSSFDHESPQSSASAARRRQRGGSPRAVLWPPKARRLRGEAQVLRKVPGLQQVLVLVRRARDGTRPEEQRQDHVVLRRTQASQASGQGRSPARGEISQVKARAARANKRLYVCTSWRAPRAPARLAAS